MQLEQWIGPVIIAAFVSAMVNMAGWYVTHRNERTRENERRKEKIRDFMIALRAEVRSELHNLNDTDFTEHFKTIEKNYRSKTYTVSVPTPAPHVVFAAVVNEIQILPEDVIDPLVLYTRQRHIIEAIVHDMRSANFASLPSSRQLTIYSDYIDLKVHHRTLAANTVNALNSALDKEAYNGQ